MIPHSLRESTPSTARSQARGLLRVDTERRSSPRFENRGLAPANVSRHPGGGRSESRETPGGIWDIMLSDRARWGASGALSPTIRSSGVESLAEGGLCPARVSGDGVEGRGPARRAARESRQDRKVAAAAGRFLVLRSASPELASGITRGESVRSAVHGPFH
jgi:hypothetical protein